MRRAPPDRNGLFAARADPIDAALFGGRLCARRHRSGGAPHFATHRQMSSLGATPGSNVNGGNPPRQRIRSPNRHLQLKPAPLEPARAGCGETTDHLLHVRLGRLGRALGVLLNRPAALLHARAAAAAHLLGVGISVHHHRRPRRLRPQASGASGVSTAGRWQRRRWLILLTLQPQPSPAPGIRMTAVSERRGIVLSTLRSAAGRRHCGLERGTTPATLVACHRGVATRLLPSCRGSLGRRAGRVAPERCSTREHAGERRCPSSRRRRSHQRHHRSRLALPANGALGVVAGRRGSSGGARPSCQVGQRPPASRVRWGRAAFGPGSAFFIGSSTTFLS